MVVGDDQSVEERHAPVRLGRDAGVVGDQHQGQAFPVQLAEQGQHLLAGMGVERAGGLDTHTGQEVLALFRELNTESLTLVLVTHDAGVAAQAHRRVSFLDGLIVADDAGAGSPQ